jgi:hypothetical protein
MNELKELDKELNTLKELQDEETLNWKFKKPSKMNKLEKKSDKKPGHVLVEYLTQKYTVRKMLVRIVAGNIIVVDNKVHILHPREMWKDGKYMWYKIREIDRLPISNRDYDKLIKQGRITVNDAVVIKAILGAIQKKEMLTEAKKWIGWAIAGVAIVGVIYFVFLK